MNDTLEHVRQRIAQAYEQRTPLRIRGGGSKDFACPPAAANADVLDTRGLRGIVAYEPSELVVTVGTGTPLAELEAALAERGQCLPFEPPHYAWSAPAGAANGMARASNPATVGGMLACGYSGPARANVGSVRDYVLGMHLINGRGQYLQFGGQVIKNVAGYDVSRLMVGSWGTLGLLTQVSLKVLSAAPAEATLALQLPQAEALEHLHRWGGQPLPLNASCWVQDAGQPMLFVRLRGAVAAVEAACERMLREAPGQRLGQAPSGRSAAEVAQDWEDCRHQQLPFFQAPAPDHALWRLSLPQTAPVLDLPWPQLVEWHGAQRWLWAPLSAYATLRDAAHAAGGHASLFKAPAGQTLDDAARSEPALAFTARWAAQGAAAQSHIAQRLKAEFDPHRIFNPDLSPTLATSV